MDTHTQFFMHECTDTQNNRKIRTHSERGPNANRPLTVGGNTFKTLIRRRYSRFNLHLLGVFLLVAWNGKKNTIFISFIKQKCVQRRVRFTFDAITIFWTWKKCCFITLISLFQTSYFSTFRQAYTVGYATSLISLISAIFVFTAFRYCYSYKTLYCINSTLRILLCTYPLRIRCYHTVVVINCETEPFCVWKQEIPLYKELHPHQPFFLLHPES